MLDLVEVDLALVLHRLEDPERDERRQALAVGRRLVQRDTVLAAVADRDGRDGRRRVVLEVVERHDAALGLDDCERDEESVSDGSRARSRTIRCPRRRRGNAAPAGVADEERGDARSTIASAILPS